MTKEILQNELTKIKENLANIEKVYYQLKGQEVLLNKLIGDIENPPKEDIPK